MNMKPWIISGICCIGAGAILAVTGLACGALDGDRWAKKLDLTTIEYQPDESFHAIEVDTDFADVTIRKGNTASVIAENAERNNFSAEVKNGVLYVTQDYHQENWIVFSIRNINVYSANITITLPEKEYSSLSIHSAMGEITLSDIQSKDIEISADCGQISMKNTQSRYTSITCAMGDLDMTDCAQETNLFLDLDAGSAELRNITAGKIFSLENSMGDVELSDMTVGRSTIAMDCGNLELHGYTETQEDEKSTMGIDMGDCDIEDSTLYCLSAELDCGNFDAENTQLLNRTEIYTDMGDIDLELRGRKSDYVILSEFSSAPENKNTIRANTDVGDIDITFTGE